MLNFSYKILENTIFKSKSSLIHHLRYNSSTQNNLKFVPFLERITERRSEAKRSIIVQVQSQKSYKELWNYCNFIGKVRFMFHYTTGIEPLHFIVIEFESEPDLNKILDSSCFVDSSQTNSNSFGVKSHFLWFRASGKKKKLKTNEIGDLSIENGTKLITDDEIRNLTKNSIDISDQIKCLYENTRLNDLGTRLRFLTALQIENSLTGIFPKVRAFPFGSSVNGYGRNGCDLDLILKLTGDKKNEDSRLVYHCKPGNGSERSMTQRQMETIGDLIHLFLPGCGNVRRILQARVPIIKYHQQITNVECDVSMSNMSGVHMSDFLYMMGEMDERVCPLIFAVRSWAKANGITNSTPGRWISNFSLTLLVLAFLQNPPSGKPVLPTLNMLEAAAGKTDKHQLEDGTDCTFLRNPTKLNFPRTNSDSLAALLLDFFIHYAQFDFEKCAVCLNYSTGNVPKPEHAPLYIINPLERGLNVSKNVSFEEILKFKMAVKMAAWNLESANEVSKEEVEEWGLMVILKSGRSEFTKKQTTRLVEMKSLFDEERVGGG